MAGAKPPPTLPLVAIVSILALVAMSCGTRVDRDEYYRYLARGGAENGSVAEERTERPAELAGNVPQGDEAAARGSLATSPRGTRPNQGTVGNMGTDAADDSPSGARTTSVSTAEVGDVIRVGIHVPITGAAPMPTDFQDYLEMMEEYTNGEAPVHGRTWDWVIEDDGYEPGKGQAACRKLAESDILFAIGHTMPAVQDGCADLFGKHGIPYLMRGTYPELLDGRPLAWFGTMADDLQGRLLADYAVSRLGAGSKNSAVVFQNDQTAAKQHFVARMEERGGTLVVEEESVPRQSDYNATIQKLQSAGAEIVFLSMPPVDAIKISVQSQGQGYHPVWMGGGTYWNYNLTLESAGMALDGAVTFSPWPTIDSAGANEFKTVFRKYRPEREPEDLGLIIWGWSQLVRRALENAGPQISRASLVEALNGLRFSEPYWSPIAYTPDDHRGTDAITVFRADGQAKRWRQVEGYMSGFSG